MSIEASGHYPVFGGNGIRGYASRYTHDGDYDLIGRQGDRCGNIHVVRGRIWASEHAVVVSSRRDYVLEWFGALLQAMNLNQYSIAAAQPGLSVDRVLNLWTTVPPANTPEQTAIAAHVDHATRTIDSAIANARRQIDLLNEYRTRLISDVVTGKLDVREAAAEFPEADPVAVGSRGAKIQAPSNSRIARCGVTEEASP